MAFVLIDRASLPVRKQQVPLTLSIEHGHAAACRDRSVVERMARRAHRALAGSRIEVPIGRAYERLLLWCTAGRGLRCALPGGEIVRLLPAYRHTTWNLDEYAAFRAVLAPGSVALDVGANLGAYAMLFGQWVGPGGRVYAFEPSPGIFDGLEQHLTLNGLVPRVVAVRAAVSDTSGPAAFVAAGLHAINRLATAQEATEESLVVSATTIDEFCAREHIEPDLIKIDVEGAELAALRGARETIRAARGRLALFVELHPSLWPSLGVTPDDVASELETQGLVAEPLRTGVDVWSLEGVTARLHAR